MLTIETPKDFYKPSQRIKILNADRHPSMQLEDVERVVEVEYVDVFIRDLQKEKETIEGVAGMEVQVEVYKIIVKTAKTSDLLFCFCDARMCPEMNDKTIGDIYENRQHLLGRKYNYLSGLNICLMDRYIHTNLLCYEKNELVNQHVNKEADENVLKWIKKDSQILRTGRKVTKMPRQEK